MASPPRPRELNKVELSRIVKQREAVLRELRVFLRDATNKLLAERKFKEFTKPVDPEEVSETPVFGLSNDTKAPPTTPPPVTSLGY